jgi:hypothetical protein
MKKTMAWGNEGRLTVVLHTAAPPAKEDWASFVTSTRALGDVRWRRVLVYSHGGSPDAVQRGALIECFKETGTARTAVLTKSSVHRVISVAVSWFNKDLKAFTFDEDELAWSFLDLTAAERRQVPVILAELTHQLGLVRAA